MNEYLKGLNSEQFKAVVFDSGPALVLAGPGSGKTRVLTCRVARLLDNGINPNEILLLTFTNKAANEMWERIIKLSNYDESDGKVTACTYHAFCITYLRKYSKLVDLDNNFTIIDNTDMLEVIKLLRENIGTNVYSNFPKGKELVSIFSSHRNTNTSIDDIVDYEYLQYRSYKKEVNELYNNYEKYKIERNLVDYDDLLVKFLELLEKNENICRTISNQYRYIMVDEYQDSNYLQFRIIKELRKFDNKNILVVGDEQQCLPKGTKITTINGLKNIEDITEEDKLLVAGGRGITCISSPESIIKKKYKDKLIKITTKTGKTLSATPNHIIFADNYIEDKYFVYLMYKKDYGFRIGKSSSYGYSSKHKVRNGYESSLSNEGGDRVWLLKICDNELEANYYEQYFAYQYGIPLYVFKNKSNNIALSQEKIKELFNSINTYDRGMQILKDFNMSFEYPHAMNQIKNDRDSRNLKRLRMTMFGSSRQHKTGKYQGYKHELSYNTIDETFNSMGQKHLGTNPSRKENIYGCIYNNGRKVSGNQDELNEIAYKITDELNDIYFIQEAVLDNELLKYKFTPFSNLRVGMHICINNNKTIVRDEIISVTEEDYDGYVYDINIPLYRNYVSNDICVHNCIYGFRGSDVHNILNFPKEFHGCTSIILNTNYRSNQEIVDVANSLISSAKEKFNKDLKATYSKGQKPYLIEAETSEIEAKYILSKIKEYKKNGIPLNDIAILVRGSRDSSPLEVLLNQSGFSYQKYGGIKFLERKHIKDIFAFLKLTQNEKDEISWFRIFQLYPFIGTTYAKRITEEILKSGLDVLLDEKYAKKKYAEYFPEIHKTISDIKKLKLNDQLDFIIKTYYFNLVEKTITESNRKESTKDEMLVDNKSNKIDAEILFEMARDYKDTNKFITDLTLEVPTITDEDEFLTISTIHSAKGLEYKIGFIINAIEGSFPSIRSNIQSKIDKETEEERRVFYVAITRVKEDLYVTYPKSSYNYNGYVSNTISRYLLENQTYKLFKRFRVK